MKRIPLVGTAIALLLFGGVEGIAAQQGTITGTVRDAQTGQGMAAVQVFIEETDDGVLSSSSGAFTIANVAPGNYTVVAQRIGYGEARQDVTVAAGETTTVQLSLTQAALDLGEIVVIGYGTETAANITGSVSRANAADVARSVAPTVGQALQGQAPGVFIKNLNSQPGENRIDINIRGFGDPLFLIDGHPVEARTFQELNPANIEDIVILKDAAAAAVYGARAGNGVVLVTTRRGMETEAPVFNYRSNFTQQFFTFMPDMANSVEHMQFYNMRSDYLGQTPQFSQDQIDCHAQYLDQVNPRPGTPAWSCPNTDMFSLLLADRSPMQQHNLSISGGTGPVRYFLSGAWLNQSGPYRAQETDFNRYNIRSNIDIALTDRWDLGLDLSVVNREYWGPFPNLQGGGGAPFDNDQVYFRAYRWKPWWPADGDRFENGLLQGALGGGNPNPVNYMWTDIAGHRDWTDQTGTIRTSLSYRLPYNFTAQSTVSFQRNNYDWEMFKRRFVEHTLNVETGEYELVRVPHVMTLLRQRRDRENSTTLNYQLRNNSVFGAHSLTGLILFEQNFTNFNRMEAWRLNYPVDVPQLFAGPDQDKDNLGWSRESGRQGIVGRLNYAYDGRYSAEFNFRYDGSSAFPEGSRWGFFPSAGVAWNISEESFIRDNPTFSFINALRFRGSYGRLGFDRAGDWQHLATYSFVDQGRYIYGPDGIQFAIRSDAIPNPHITWENMDLGNVGVNFEFWNGLLGGEFDVFRRTRSDVLGSCIAEVPDMVGATLPQENYQRFRNDGWDASLTHANTLGEVGYRLGLTVSKTRQTLLHTDTRQFLNREDERRNNPIGQYTGRVWRMPTDGLFTSWEEIHGWADIDGRNNATIQPGDYRFIDRNGDGRISLEDAYVVGSDATPKFSYGISAGANWRGFELYMMWQGAAAFGHDLMNTAIYIQPDHFGNNNIGKHHVFDSYVPADNRWGIPANTNARWPCVCTDGPGSLGNNSWSGIGGGATGRADAWFADGKYLRLRNLQLAYQVPTRWTERIGVDQARVTLAGYNLLTFYDLDFIDAEYDTANQQHDRYSPLGQGAVGSSYPGNHFPSLGSYSLGFEVNF